MGAVQNNEDIQCRAGAYAGLIFSSLEGSFTETKDMSFENTVDGPELQLAYDDDNKLFHIRGIPVARPDDTGKDRYLKNGVGYINSFSKECNEKNAKMRTYIVSKCHLPVYYDFMETSRYNYNLFGGGIENEAKINRSSFNESNIFNEDNSYVYSIDLFKPLFMLEGNGKFAIANELDCYEGYKARGEYSVFAGFVHDGKTYNRSYWSMPKKYTEEKGIEFYSIPHWAGESIGGVVY